MGKFIKLFAISLVLFCYQGHTQPLMEGISVKYVLKVSWENNYHGRISHYWLLEESQSELQEVRSLQLDSLKLMITPLISPRYIDEYLFCCEKNNINAINSKNSQLLKDSLKGKYDQRYKEYYVNEDLRLNQKKALIINYTLNEEYKITLFKINAETCKCMAADNNPGSSYTDTIANISKIISYENFTKKERKQIKANIEKIFANKIILESLPQSGGRTK